MPYAQAERLRLAALLASAAFVADWASKSWALDTLHAPRPLGALLLEVVHNPVFAFSAGHGVAPAALVVGIRLLGLLGLLLLARRVVRHGGRYAAGIGLMVGGGIGNTADLVFRRHGVVDFIGAGPWSLELADAPFRFHVVFNAADLAVLIGIALLAPLIRTWALALQRRLAAWEERWLTDRAW